MDEKKQIDIVVQHEGEIVPVEVKAGEDKKASTFKNYVREMCPRWAIRFSRRNLKRMVDSSMFRFISPRGSQTAPSEDSPFRENTANQLPVRRANFWYNILPKLKEDQWAVSAGRFQARIA